MFYNLKNKKPRLFIGYIGLVIFSLFLLSSPKKSWSLACAPCSCTLIEAQLTMEFIELQHELTREFITDQFRAHIPWVFSSGPYYGGARDSFIESNIIPALIMMTEQLVTVGMQQMFILGTFFDAKLQLETQQLFQKKVAEAHRDYHPSAELCAVGTTARGLASSDRNGALTAHVLSQRSLDRQLGMRSTNAAHSAGLERRGRIEQFKERYCDTRDNNGTMNELCEGGKAPLATINKDIDYMRTVDMNRTLNIDFTDNDATNDEIDVLALASNLFSHEVLDKPGRTAGGSESAEGPYLEMRSLIAKRGVAEHSFNAIIGLKTAGTETSENTMRFTKNIFGQFGVDNEDHQRILLGGTLNQDGGRRPGERPSYYAQMEVLAQKLYQDPEFYSNLYDKPANVLRKEASMQAINLMLDRDLYKSELRSEMALAVWLEMELLKYQNDIQNRMNAMVEGSEEN